MAEMAYAEAPAAHPEDELMVADLEKRLASAEARAEEHSRELRRCNRIADGCRAALAAMQEDKIQRIG